MKWRGNIMLQTLTVLFGPVVLPIILMVAIDPSSSLSIIVAVANMVMLETLWKMAAFTTVSIIGYALLFWPILFIKGDV